MTKAPHAKAASLIKRYERISDQLNSTQSDDMDWVEDRNEILDKIANELRDIFRDKLDDQALRAKFIDVFSGHCGYSPFEGE